MIRIDEIYSSIFLPLAERKDFHSIHWFDPFGSTQFQDLCSLPVVSSAEPGDPTKPNHACVRFFFWDQEPLHRENFDQTLSKFCQIYDTGTRYLITSEQHSEFVDAACNSYGFVPMYYFFHGWAALDWYRGYHRSFLVKPFLQRHPTKTFLCPNNIIGGRRQHRLLLLEQFQRRQLLDCNLISFPAVCPYENRSITELCQEYGIDLGPIDLPLTIDDGADHQGKSHCIDMWHLAEQSLLHVITETVYSGRRWHLTEKTFRPIVMQQPFVLVSCKGSLEYLRSYGFKTFGDFWDESYDQHDDDTRIIKIAELLAHLDGMTPREKMQLQKHLAPVVAYNHAWFYQGDFESRLWDELSVMLQQLSLLS